MLTGIFLAAIIPMALAPDAAAQNGKGVQVTRNDVAQRVDVTIDGQPFTSYIWPAAAKKPVLYPLRTAKGTMVTRGYPPRPGEPTDHPHHIGFWLNYGDVNGMDFWGNSEGLKPEERTKKGTIVHKAIKSASGGATRGELESSEGQRGDAVWGTAARWVMLQGKIGGEDITLAVLDHPSNPAHPTHWHARGYGLFAVNPFGVKDFSQGAKTLNYALEPRASLAFRHRVVILSAAATPEQMDTRFKEFAKP